MESVRTIQHSSNFPSKNDSNNHYWREWAFLVAGGVFCWFWKYLQGCGPRNYQSNGLLTWTPSIICPWFKSSVTRTSARPLAAATTIMTSKKKTSDSAPGLLMPAGRHRSEWSPLATWYTCTGFQVLATARSDWLPCAWRSHRTPAKSGYWLCLSGSSRGRGATISQPRTSSQHRDHERNSRDWYQRISYLSNQYPLYSSIIHQILPQDAG